MATTSETTKWTYPGGSGTTQFSFTQQILYNTDIRCYLIDAAGTVYPDLILNTDYTVSGILSNGMPDPDTGDWFVTYPAGATLASGWTFNIEMNVPYEQPISLTGLGGYSPFVVEKFIADRLALQTAQINTRVDNLEVLDVADAVTTCTNAANTATAAESAAAISETNANNSAIAAAASAASITLPLPITIGGTGQITAPLAREALGAAGTSQTFSKELQTSYVANGTIRLWGNTPIVTLTSLSAICDSGTCTATFYIDGVAVTTGALSVSSTIATVTPTALNVTSVGSVITVVITSNSSCLNMAITAQYTQTLS